MGDPVLAPPRRTGRWALLEAIAHLTKGLELFGTLTNGPEQPEEELAPYLAISGRLIVPRGSAMAIGHRRHGQHRGMMSFEGQAGTLLERPSGDGRERRARGRIDRRR